jgi:predicted DNA-binding transcriptional regulator AlpA
MAELTINAREAAERSGIGINEIYDQCKNNPAFPAFKIGRKTLIYTDGFDKWVAEIAQQRSGYRK